MPLLLHKLKVVVSSSSSARFSTKSANPINNLASHYQIIVKSETHLSIIYHLQFIFIVASSSSSPIILIYICPNIFCSRSYSCARHSHTISPSFTVDPCMLSPIPYPQYNCLPFLLHYLKIYIIFCLLFPKGACFNTQKFMHQISI